MSTDNTQEDYDENTSAGIYGNGLDHPDGEQPTTPAAHTPLPWKIFPNYETGTCSIGHYGKSAPLVNHVCELPDIQSHDAEFIVRACNNHERLVAMLKRVTDELADLIKDEYDEPSVGITGWNSLHESVSSARAALAALNAEEQ